MKAVVNSLINSKLEIIAIQESHLLKNEIDSLKQIWQGPLIYSEGTNNSKGLCILFNNYFNNDSISILFSTDRILLCSFKVGEEYFYLCNIYAPNDNKAKKEFYILLQKTLNSNLDSQQMKKTIILGDFNCVLNNEIDIIINIQS